MNTNISLVGVVNDELGLYRGNLRHYFKAVFERAKNLNNPYHNFRHLFHITWLCYQALEHEKERVNSINPEESRALLIAAMFHDFDHTGRTGNDDLNIQYAIRGIRNNILEEDKPLLPLIEDLICATEFPVTPKYHRERPNISIIHKILCDADLSQAFSVAWLQQVIFGLANEMYSTPRKVLEFQETFLKSIVFYSSYFQDTFNKGVIDQKIKESNGLLGILK